MTRIIQPDLLGTRLTNMGDAINPQDAVNLSQVSTPWSVTITESYMLERGWTSTWPYARGNGASSNLWWAIANDWTVKKITVTDNVSSSSWTYALLKNWSQIFTFSTNASVFSVNTNIDYVAWDTIAFSCTIWGTWGTRVATIEYEYDVPLQWLQWPQGIAWQDWLNAWVTVSQNTTTLPPANSFTAWTILRIDLWTKTWQDQDEYITDGTTWTFLGNVLGAAWSWTQVEYAKVSFNNSNTVNNWINITLDTFDSVLFESKVWFVSTTAWADWITISETWVYKCTFSAFYNNINQERNSPWSTFTVNWVNATNTNANNYMRNFAAHDSSWWAVTELLELNSWDVLWISHTAYWNNWWVVLNWSKTSLDIAKIW